jgi:Skp family chaperone for outer membrane proteins
MRVSHRWFIVVLLLLAAQPVVAGKIGFVDAETAVTTVQEGQAKIKELEAWATPERERVEQLSADLAEIRQKIVAQRSVASEEVLRQLQDEELQARRTFEDARREFERQLEVKQNEFLADVAVKVGRVASDYGKANDYDAIFLLSAQPLVYVAESANLTDTVIRLYNERFPGE